MEKVSIIGIDIEKNVFHLRLASNKGTVSLQVIRLLLFSRSSLIAMVTRPTNSCGLVRLAENICPASRQ